NEPVKRSQAASMIVEALDLETENRPAPDFTDITDSFHAYDLVATVNDEGIITGNDGRFMPNNVLKRGQMAAILDRSFEFESSESNYDFNDITKDYIFAGSIEAIAGAGITTGYSSDNTFRPNNETTRAQFSVFLARTLDDSFIDEDTGESTKEEDTKGTEPTGGEMEVHFLDVGQGDSILVEAASGE
ncbi:MBL fold metallo-hydrolase, partial [Salibacterium salarium]